MDREEKSGGGTQGAESGTLVLRAPICDEWERFCLEYLIDYDPGAAYIRCGMGGHLDSVKAARKKAEALLSRDDVHLRICELRKEQQKRLMIDAERVTTELAIVGFSNIDDYRIDPDTGRVTAPEGRPEALRAIASTETIIRTIPGRNGGAPIREVRTKIKLWPKPEALRELSVRFPTEQQVKDKGPSVIVLNGIDLAAVTGRKILPVEDRRQDLIIDAEPVDTAEIAEALRDDSALEEPASGQEEEGRS